MVKVRADLLVVPSVAAQREFVDQILFLSYLDLYHKLLDSGERRYKSGT